MTGEKHRMVKKYTEGDIGKNKQKACKGTVKYTDRYFYLSLFGNDEKEFNQCMCFKDWIIKAEIRQYL